MQAENVYPQLLLARILFSLGGSATATMVTAILPRMVSHRSGTGVLTSRSLPPNSHDTTTSLPGSSGTHPLSKMDHRESSGSGDISSVEPLPTRLAGLVGLATGCGALLALSLFLPLPNFFQRKGFHSGTAVRYSFYLVGMVSFVVALFCWIGLRNLGDESQKDHLSPPLSEGGSGGLSPRADRKKLTLVRSLFKSFRLAFEHPEFFLSYVGGFVARASSVGVTLFVPLYVNAYYKKSGLCDEHFPHQHPAAKHCRYAYILAAKLTGVSQLAALIFAPIFGYLAERYHRLNSPLLTAALTGVVGYLSMTSLHSPNPQAASGTYWIYLAVSLLGVSQIGAIVCSLGLLGHSILELTSGSDDSGRAGKLNDGCANPVHGLIDGTSDLMVASRHTGSIPEEVDEESHLLLGNHESSPVSYEEIKGSIAGVYSLFGGAGILLLTKTGGVLFDKVSTVAPFYLLALINGILLLVGIGCTIITRHKED